MPRFSPALVASVVLAGAGLLAGSGCSSSSSTTGSVPPGAGITCSTTTNAADTEGARAALASAPAGTCVVLTGASYAGPFSVPAGVALVAHNGSRAIITGGTAQDAAIALAEGAQLVGVDVLDAVGVGIAIRAANAVVNDVTVTGSRSAALAILCKEATTPGCAAGTVRLDTVTLAKSGLGLWAAGAHIVMRGGSSTSHAGTSLAAAAGIIAQEGAKLELDGVSVDKNQGVGILVDGAATTALIKSSIVSENGERGVWAQFVAGTLEAPAVRIEETKLEKNKIVGVGSVESRGIIIVGGRIADTVAAPLVTNLQTTEPVGDGIGIFSSGDFTIEGTVVESNARAAGVVDGSDRGIIIVGGKVSAGASGLKFVVQNTKGGDVQVPESDRSATPSALGVSAPKLALPPVL